MSGTPLWAQLQQQVEAHVHAGASEAAAALLQAALATDRVPFTVWVWAASVAIRGSRWQLAIQWLEHALQLQPDAAPVRRQLSQVLNRSSTDPTLASSQRQAALDRALRLWPENTAAGYNLALLLLDQDSPRALQVSTALRGALPDDPELLWLHAEAAARCGLAAALTSTEHTELSRKPAAARRIAEMMAWNGTPGAAQPLSAALCAQDPQQVLSALTGWLGLPACYRSRDELAHARAHYAEAVRALPERLSPTRLREHGVPLEQLAWCNFLLAYQGADDRDLQQRYGDWLLAACEAVYAGPRVRLDGARRRGRYRIGLASSFWRNCTVGAYFGSWVQALANPEHELFLICTGSETDEYTAQLAAAADHCVQLRGPLSEQAATVAALDLDLLIYPELGMHGATLVLAALPLARRQACGWGHPVTSGLPSIQTFLSVASMEPEDAALHYCESLSLLPDLGTRYARPTMPERLSRTQLGLPERGALLIVASSAFKWHPDGDAELATLLAQRPEAHVVLLRTEASGAMQRLQARIEDALKAAGARSGQVLWLPAQPRPRFLQLLGACDVLLDPWHWSGGNTTLDALHAGLPILTRHGRFMRGRQSAAMLDMLDLSDGVGTYTLLDEPEARVRWRQRVQAGLTELTAGSAALAALHHWAQTELAA